MSSSHRPLLQHRTWPLAIGAILLALIGFFANERLRSHDETLASATINSQNIARVLDEQINGVIQKTSLALDHLADEDELATSPEKYLADQEKLKTYLKKIKLSLPEVQSIRIIKADGYSLASTRDSTRSPYYGDRNYFIHHRDNPSLDLAISEPIHGYTSGIWQVMITRRINNPDGSFAGVVSSAIALSHFEKLFSSINLGRDSNVTLLSKDLQIVTRFPISENLRQKSLRGALIEKALVQNPRAGTYSGKSVVDGVERVFSYRQVGELPLYIVVGISKQQALAEWRRIVLIDSILLAGLITAISWLAYTLLRHYRRELESENRLREITSNLAEGVYVLDQKGLVTFANPELERLIGWSEPELLGKDGHETFHYKKPDGTPVPSPDCPVHQTMLTGHTYRAADEWLIRKDGTAVPVSIAASPIIKDGKIVGSVAAVTDTSQRLAAGKALRESEERFRNTLEYAPIGMALVSLEGHFIQVNQALSAIMGHPKDELKELTVQDLTHPDDRDADQILMQRLLSGQVQSYKTEKRCLHKTGRQLWVQLTISLMHDVQGNPLYFIAQIEDITERRQYQEQIHHLAYYDSLTNLPNRRLLLSRLDQALAQAKRYQRALAVMFLDLDNFKRINDTLGHDTGDALLQEVAQRLNACIRKGDTVSRQGGDEFVIILAEIAHPRDASLVAEKIIHTLQEPLIIQGHELHITTSIGISIYPVNGTDNSHELLKKADMAMYEAKEAGRNRYCCHAEN